MRPRAAAACVAAFSACALAASNRSSRVDASSCDSLRAEASSRALPSDCTSASWSLSVSS